jgi:hypothetical protein
MHKSSRRVDEWKLLVSNCSTPPNWMYARVQASLRAAPARTAPPRAASDRPASPRATPDRPDLPRAARPGRTIRARN